MEAVIKVTVPNKDVVAIGVDSYDCTLHTADGSMIALDWLTIDRINAIREAESNHFKGE